MKDQQITRHEDVPSCKLPDTPDAAAPVITEKEPGAPLLLLVVVETSPLASREVESTLTMDTAPLPCPVELLTATSQRTTATATAAG